MYIEMGTLIIMGDFNAHVNGKQFVKPHNRRSALFSRFLASNNFVSLNTLPLCTGAWSSFVSYSGEHTSMIDHILVPTEKVDLVTECRILDDDALNVSNHRPVCCLILFPHAEQTDLILSVRKSVHWRRAKPEEIVDFRNDVETRCLNISLNEQHSVMLSDIDSKYRNICDIISVCSEKHLPYRKGFKHFLKPYWDETIKELHKSMREKRRLWILDNRPRGDCYISYKECKLAKRLFRQYHRKCAQNYLKSLNEEIDHAAEVSSEYFWKMVNKRKNNNSSNVGCEINFQNRTYRDPGEICNQWGQYFASLYQATDENCYDSVNYRSVKLRVDTLKQRDLDPNSFARITETELNDAISNLSKGKTCGEDKIDNEHIIHSGPILRTSLLYLYNSMLHSSYIPNSMKRGVIITLFKGGNKRKDDPNSYRAITLTSSVLKLFERILYSRLSTSMEKKLNPLQGGFQRHIGCNMTSYLLHESIYYTKENNSKLYVCFLDAQKAFDKVWHEGLFLKLFEMGVELYLLKVLISLHDHLSSYVLFRGFKSIEFNISGGTRQGGVLSPFLFLCFINDLLNELCASNLGLSINGINLTCPTVADDMLLQSLSKVGLELLINICVRYFHQWRLDYNPLKCAVIVFNEPISAYRRSQRKWFLGDSELQETDNYTHLGIVCNKYMNMKENVQESASKIRKIFFGLLNSAFSETELHPLTLKRIYDSVVLPKALYGCELWCDIRQSDILALERSHRLCLKTIQGIGRNTRTCVALSLIGAVALQYEIEKRKFILFGQLCRLDNSFAVKRLFIYRLTSKYLFNDIDQGFMFDIFQCLTKYNLKHIVEDFVNSGSFPSKYSWKSILSSKIRVYANQDFVSQAAEHELQLFLTFHQQVEPSMFWNISRKYPRMLNACRSVIKLTAKYFSRFSEAVCSACGTFSVNYVSHCLFLCHANKSHRHKMWMGLWRKFGADLYIRMASFDNDTLLSVLFGNFELVGDILNINDKLNFYGFLARFIHIQKLVCDGIVCT